MLPTLGGNYISTFFKATATMKSDNKSIIAKDLF